MRVQIDERVFKLSPAQSRTVSYLIDNPNVYLRQSTHPSYQDVVIEGEVDFYLQTKTMKSLFDRGILIHGGTESIIIINPKIKKL